MVREHEAEWIAAICKDVGKPAVEADVSEISNVYAVATALMRGLKSWMNPQQHSTFGLLFPASCEAFAHDNLKMFFTYNSAPLRSANSALRRFAMNHMG